MSIAAAGGGGVPWTNVGALVGSLVALAGVIGTTYRNRQKAKTVSSATSLEGWAKLVSAQQSDTAALRVRVQEVEKARDGEAAERARCEARSEEQSKQIQVQQLQITRLSQDLGRVQGRVEQSLRREEHDRVDRVERTDRADQRAEEADKADKERHDNLET